MWLNRVFVLFSCSVFVTSNSGISVFLEWKCVWPRIEKKCLWFISDFQPSLLITRPSHAHAVGAALTRGICMYPIFVICLLSLHVRRETSAEMSTHVSCVSYACLANVHTLTSFFFESHILTSYELNKRKGNKSASREEHGTEEWKLWQSATAQPVVHLHIRMMPVSDLRTTALWCILVHACSQPIWLTARAR
jgi:hypothetical protein